MSDRTDWLSTLSTEELLFMRKAYDVINQSMCWTIESYRAAKRDQAGIGPQGAIVGLNNESKSRFDE